MMTLFSNLVREENIKLRFTSHHVRLAAAPNDALPMRVPFRGSVRCGNSKPTWC
jgi:hypothetical protein